MAKQDFDMIVGFLDFYEERERTVRRVVDRLIEAGFTYALKKKTGKEVDIHALMASDFARNRGKIQKACAGHQVDKAAGSRSATGASR